MWCKGGLYWGSHMTMGQMGIAPITGPCGGLTPVQHSAALSTAEQRAVCWELHHWGHSIHTSCDERVPPGTGDGNTASCHCHHLLANTILDSKTITKSSISPAAAAALTWDPLLKKNFGYHPSQPTSALPRQSPCAHFSQGEETISCRGRFICATVDT